eukprot:Pgem_evm1s8573
MCIRRFFTIVVAKDANISDFERDFESISVIAVTSKQGYISHEIGYPEPSSGSRVYTMISIWDSVESLRLFAGPNWASESFIPQGMEKYVESCSVQHFTFRKKPANNFADESVAVASTPKDTPYYAVIFTSVRKDGDDGYGDMAIKMVNLAKEQDGFLGIESAREDVGITVSYWKDLDSIKHWKQNIEHKVAQKYGRQRWYAQYKVRVSKVERDY